MKTLVLAVDERELSTIRAGLLLLQEQIDALPEDLAEMMCEYGRPMTDAEIDQLSRRLGIWQEPPASHLDAQHSGIATLGKIEWSPKAGFVSKRTIASGSAAGPGRVKP